MYTGPYEFVPVSCCEWVIQRSVGEICFGSFSEERSEHGARFYDFIELNFLHGIARCIVMSVCVSVCWFQCSAHTLLNCAHKHRMHLSTEEAKSCKRIFSAAKRKTFREDENNSATATALWNTLQPTQRRMRNDCYSLPQYNIFCYYSILYKIKFTQIHFLQFQRTFVCLCFNTFMRHLQFENNCNPYVGPGCIARRSNGNGKGAISFRNLIDTKHRRVIQCLCVSLLSFVCWWQYGFVDVHVAALCLVISKTIRLCIHVITFYFSFFSVSRWTRATR